MKVYISLPITGHDIEEVEARCIFAGAVLEKKGHVAALLECDAAVFLDGWETSRGCRLEFWAARTYGKEVMFEPL